MSSDMDKVIAAAGVLDRFGPSDWRSKIDLTRLKMYSSRDCILGQIYGEYNDGLEQLTDRSGFDADTFCGFDEEWKRYLSSPVAPFKQYVNNNDKTHIVSLVNEFTLDGETWVNYRRLLGSVIFANRKDRFLATFTEKTKYVVGRLYQSANGADIFMYDEDDTFFRFGQSSKFSNLDSTGYDSVYNYERDYGPLFDVMYSGNTFSAVKD
jgi:hypothetical protein